MSKERRPPPLHIYGQDIKNTIELAKGIKVQNFEIKRINTDKHTLKTDTLENYNNLKEILNEVNTRYYTFTPKELKPKTLVLRGMTDNENLEELQTDIEAHHNVKVQKIIQMKSKRPSQLKKLLPMYIVQFSPDTHLNEVYNINALNYQKIAWQPLNKSDSIMQCKNCQRYGHTATNCSLGFRCVKCASNHIPGECPISNEKGKEDIYCINCKQSGHPASYKGCPVYQTMVARLKKKIDERKKNQQTEKSVPKMFSSIKVTKENGTFAEIMKGVPTKQSSLPQQQPQQYDQTIIQQLTTRIDSMAKTIEQQSEQIAQLLQIIGQL